MNKKKMWTVVCVAALLVCLGAGGYAIHYKLNERQGEAAYEELKETAREKKPGTDTLEGKISEVLSVTTKETEAPKKKAEISKTPTPSPIPVEIPIDFDALRKENEEIYAWITIPETGVDYPVLQSSTDDSFYIHRGVDGNYLYAGTIYSEMQNHKDFSDFNTVLYGHNMKDGSMFASLHLFKDREFFDKNKGILVYTPEHIYHYSIFAGYTYDDRHILNSFDFQDKEARKEYLEEVFAVRTMDAFFDEDLKVTSEDKILTLSTCIGNAPYSRYLVQGVLTEVE